ncbi:MAG: hypothetical protein RR365_15335 [Bacteroides sp.]
MARQKGDGKGRIGGRAAGTPNKATADLKTWVASILDNGRDKFERDLEDLDPSERVKVYTSLMNYVLPKQQAISVDEQIDAEYKRMEEFLDSCPEETMEEIVRRIKKMQNEKRGK